MGMVSDPDVRIEVPATEMVEFFRLGQITEFVETPGGHVILTRPAVAWPATHPARGCVTEDAQGLRMRSGIFQLLIDTVGVSVPARPAKVSPGDWLWMES